MTDTYTSTVHLYKIHFFRLSKIFKGILEKIKWGRVYAAEVERKEIGE